jgi:methionyl aminopeptidase
MRIPLPRRAARQYGSSGQTGIPLARVVEPKTEEQITGIRKSGRLASQTLDMLTERIEPGITTGQIDDWVREFTIEHGAIPATLGYKGFPKSCCTSINEVVCHGIPGSLQLRDGDIINVDVTPILDGYYGDVSRMYFVGDASAEARRLVSVTRECLYLGIQQVRPHARVGDIGAVIQEHAERQGFSVVRNLCGHGTGIEFHDNLVIPHYGRRGTGVILYPNMVFTIEPMINAGSFPTRTLEDGWTIVTLDGSLSAQWEHTVRVTETGVEILTN